MAAETTRTSLAELVPTESIQPAQSFRFNPSLMGSVGNVRNVAKGQGGVLRWGRWTEMIVSGTPKSEAAAASNVEADLAEASCTAGYYVLPVTLTREAAHDAVGNVESGIAIEMQKAMQNRLEIVALATITGASHTVGSAASNFDLPFLATGIANYESIGGNALGGETFLICSSFQWSTLVADLALDSAPIAGLVDAFGTAFNATPGYRGRVLGCRVFVSDNLPTEGGTSRSACIGAMGAETSPLGIGVWQPTQFEIDPQPASAMDTVVASARFGCVWLDHQGTELISDIS